MQDKLVGEYWYENKHVPIISVDEIRQILVSVSENIKGHYGVYYDDNLQRRFGLTYTKTSVPYVDSGQGLLLENIPTDILLRSGIGPKDMEGLKLQGTWALGYKIENGKVIYRLFKYSFDSKRNVYSFASESDIENGWVMGYLEKRVLSDGSIEYTRLPQALMVVNGKSLEGRIAFEEDEFHNPILVDRNKNPDTNEIDHSWTSDEHLYESKFTMDSQGRVDGLDIIGITTHSFGTENTLIYSRHDLTNSYLRHEIENSPSKRWSGKYYNPKKSIDGKIVVSLFDADFTSLSLSQQEGQRSLAGRRLTELIIAARVFGKADTQNRFIALPEFILKSINSGKGYLVLNTLFNSLFKSVPSLIDLKKVKWEDDNIIYKLFSIALRSGRNTYSIQDVCLREDVLSGKNFASLWLELFRAIDKSKLDPSKKSDYLVLECFCKTFSGTFDLSSYLFSDEEFKLFKEIIRALEKFWGPHFVSELYQGRVFPKYGVMRFMGLPWKTISSNIRSRKVTYDYFPQSKYNPDAIFVGHEATELRRSVYGFLSLVSPLNIRVQSLDGSYKEIDVQRQCIKLWAPDLCEINLAFLAEQLTLNPWASQDMIMREVSNSLYDIIFQKMSDFSIHFIDRAEGSFILYNQIIECLKAKGMGSYELSCINSELMSLFVSDEGIALKFRREFYDWLGSQGFYSCTFRYGLSKNRVFTLTSLDYENFFKPFIDKFSYSLIDTLVYQSHTVSEKQKMALESLKKNEEFILDVLGFLEFASQQAGNKKLIIYPFSASYDGYGLRTSVLYKAGQNNFFAALRGSVNEWKLRGASTVNSFGFYYDPNDLTIFKDQFPIFLGLLLADPSTFVIRVADDKDIVNSDNDCYFIADLAGNVLPGSFRRSPSLKYVPKSGLRWSEGSDEDYQDFLLFKRWAEIIRKHKVLPVPRFGNPSDFYSIVEVRKFLK